ncbi:flagellin [[Clostridium] hylemonae]|uniref:flagellin N-terminal helical domain-containing protein n=1 Tax=[Clostridium] hylemonae TaxID=89153 RepID=UPI00018A266B|nr:flagellin [[Clostridium] hylemonae]QEK19469.1 Flagellin [[Clostridium] hylemonae DSM 15053]
MRIQHNIAALNSYRNLTNNNGAVSKNLEKLSSGYRINRAGDDAAGLAISEKMRAQITGLETAQKNANDGISLVQTAEGALTEVHSMLNRMVELADQSANGTYDNETDRANLQKEIQSLKDEIDRISEGTNFNGINLLDGSLGSGTTGVTAASAANTAATAGNFDAQVNFSFSGLEAGKTVTVKTVAKGTASGITADASGNITLALEAEANKTYTQADIDKLINDATLPKSASGLKITIDNDIKIGTTDGAADVVQVNAAVVAAAKNSSATDAANGITVTANTAGSGNDGHTLTFDNTTGNAKGVTVLANGNVTINLAGGNYTASEINSMLAKAGADMTVSFDGTKSDADLKGAGAAGVFTLAGGAGLASGGGLTLQIGDTADSFNQLTVKVGNMSSTSLGIGAIDISTQEGGKAAVDLIKSAINQVSSTRGDLGAIQNRLEHTINNLSVTTENMTAAESRIRDVDMANEMMAYTKNNILVQASQAMLAQANQIPQGVLQLLQ